MARGAKTARLRIIGGRWRSRMIPFASETGVRPTGARIRETLFNWLQAVVPGARCLDLFAGSGALGFEALSRGASEVVMVDHDVRAVQQLQANAETLGASGARIVWTDAFDYLSTPGQGRFDIVFLDPPFREDILSECCAMLERHQLVNTPAWIYIETDRRRPPPVLPPRWGYLHSKTAGDVAYFLARRGPSE